MKNVHDLLGCYANIWIRQKKFEKAGQTIGGHKHKYDHVSLLSSGTVEVKVDNITKTFTAPTFIVIRKDKIHDVTSLTDDVLWYCIFANRDIEGEVYDPELNCPLDKESSSRIPKNKIEEITIEEF